MNINIFYILMSVWLCVSGVMYAESNNEDSNIYWDESNIFLLKEKDFVERYFYKPLKTLGHITGDIKVLTMNIDDDLNKICSSKLNLIYDKEYNTCYDIDRQVTLCAHPKTPQDMEKYISESFDIPINSYNSGYMFIDDSLCGYVGQIEIFGYIWNFNSRGGSIELNRITTHNENITSITKDPLQSYKQGLIQLNVLDRHKMADNKNKIIFKHYLVCDSKNCVPRAEKTDGH